MSKIQTVHLFNCDKTYDLNAVEAWLEKERSKQGFSIRQHYFSLPKMSEISNETIPGLTMDLAVFVVHAHESRLSINEENAGIGYAMIYRALLQKTGDNVIITIGGDDNYRNEDEERKEFISRWAKRKVSSQFNDEYMDGRKSFILSWNKEHREIHEEALCHFLDPSRRGTKFEYKPKRKLPPRPEESPNVREVTSCTEPRKLSSAMMTAPSDPLQQEEKDNFSERATSHISSSEMRSSSSGDVQNLGVRSDKGTSSGLPETQGKSIDLVILGCHISEESVRFTEEVFRSLCSPLHIESRISKNCSPFEAKVCLEKNVARFCVLLADAKTVNDAYSNLRDRRREYEDLLKTAANRVAEKVIVVIFKPCSLPTIEDENLVTQSIESTLVKTGKGHLLFVKDDLTMVKLQRLRGEIINLFPFLKNQLHSNDSNPRTEFQHSSNVTERTVHNTFKGRKPAHPPQHTTEYRGYHQDSYQSQQSASLQPRGPQGAYQGVSYVKGSVLLRSRLVYGKLRGVEEIYDPGFSVSPDLEREMYEKCRSIPEAVVEVKSNRRGGCIWSFSTNESLVQLGQNETVMLKTRLCKGRISFQKEHLEFIYPEWKTPQYIMDDLMKRYYSIFEKKLYIISNEKEELRIVVCKEGFFGSTKNR